MNKIINKNRSLAKLKDEHFKECARPELVEGFERYYKKSNGFTLIEFIAYIGIFAFIALIFFGVTSKAQLKFVTNSGAQEVLLRQSIAIDLLRRDLMSASSLATDWYTGNPASGNTDSQAFVFKKLTLSDNNLPQSSCVCWTIGNQGLVRLEGDYDFANHEWVKKYTSLVCKTIKQIDFVLQKHQVDGMLSGVWVTYQASDFQPIGSQQTQNAFAQKSFAQKIFVKFRNRILM